MLESLALGQTPAAPSVPIPASSSTFPVRRVALYKNGVGYFEHLGQVQNNQDVSIRFTSGQLNDVLKSLTVLDLSGGRISGVNYGSAAPLTRRLDDLHLPSGETTTLTEFLSALRGAKLEVHNGAAVVTGRLLSVERKTRMGSGATLEVDYLSLITDSGEVKTAEITPAFSVRILDRDLRGNVDRYMDALASAKDADLRRMVVSTVGTGTRNLFVSYISEVPVWKTTYRLVLSKKPQVQPLLQGWAIVDNTVGEDWSNVELSLIAGAPVSFIQRLSEPYYVHRPEIGLPQGFTQAPQTHEAVLSYGTNQRIGTVSDPTGAVVANARVRVYGAGNLLVGETVTGGQGRFSVPALPDTVERIEVSSPGFRTTALYGSAANTHKPLDIKLDVGSSAESVTVTAEASTVQTESGSLSNRSSRSLGSGSGLGGGGTSYPLVAQPNSQRRPAMASAINIAEARSQLEAAASSDNLGELFEYRIKEPITIRKDQSALVPILQSPVEAEKVSVWNPASASPRPLHALWLHNTSGATLDGGSFSVLDQEAFAGEGVIDQVRPGERRLISYAVDLALNASSRRESASQRVTRFHATGGVLRLYSEVRESTTYTFRNEDTTARSVIVEHPVRPEFELRGDAKPIETTREWQRFRVEAGPKQTATLGIVEARPLETAYQISNLNPESVALLIRQRSISAALEAELQRIFEQRQTVSALEDRAEALEKEKAHIFDDQQRLRENLKSLKGSAEEKRLVERYTQQLNQQEDRLAALDKAMEDLELQKTADDEKLASMIDGLEVDTVL